MEIIIGSDHAGFDYKEKIVALLEAARHTVKDVGPETADSVDYPDFAHPVAKGIQEGQFTLGILICGSGNGVCMTANKYADVRAGLCWNVELAALARQHNNANVLCLPARFVTLEEAKNITLA
ncbi:MAG: RpiB/LacA/LacB family sugar-phosphate isomerase, partial [Bacteroidota bacterium]